MSDRRVVITGLGILSPLGNKIEQVWSSILKGESGVSEITSFVGLTLTCLPSTTV